MPACLIELGFITTPDEEKFLNNKSNIDKMARGIYEAFAKYKDKYDKNIAVPYKADRRRSDDIPDTFEEEKAERTDGDEAGKDRRDDAGKTAESNDVKAVGGQETADRPVFKVQILASSRLLAEGSSHFKGLDGVDCYEEGGLYKYTYGASTDYNEVYRLRKSILDKFPEAFIIAFKNGAKMNVNQAIREFKSK